MVKNSQFREGDHARDCPIDTKKPARSETAERRLEPRRVVRPQAAGSLHGLGEPDESWGDGAVIRRTTSRSRFDRLRVGILLWAALGMSSPALAQSTLGRKLRTAEIRREEESWIIDVRFEVPIRYLRHEPESPGRTLRIRVDPVERGGEPERPIPREVLPLPAGERGPVRQIVYDGSIFSSPIVEILFDETLDFEVTQGSDFRSLRVIARQPRPARAPSPSSGARGAAASGAGAVALKSARRAIRDGDNALAIALLTRVLERPASEVDPSIRMDAQELLGLTHERMGQRAHARAEYEAYLQQYPDGPGAKRVAQRLDALLTAAAEPRAPLKKVEVQTLGTRTGEFYGSVSARYFRSDLVVLDEEGDLDLSDVYTDMNLTGRLDDEDWRLRGDFVGSYDYDLSSRGRSDDLFINTLSIQAEDRLHGLEATIGRQRRSDSGILGRFDGLRVAARLGSRFEIAAVAGLPVESLRDTTPQTDVILGGGSVDVRDLGLEGLSAQLYVIGQEAWGMTDRVAVGGEFRLSRGRSFSVLYVDYDVVFESLNTVFLSSTLPATPDLDVLLFFERRNAPILSLTTALQGQPVSDLDGLRDLFSESEIREIAKDRTAVLWSGTTGVNYRADARLQLSGDFTVSHLGGTETVAGVEGFDAIGPDFSASLQATLTDWLLEGGVGSVGARFYEGDSSRALLLTGTARIPVVDRLRIRPILQAEWRDSGLEGDRARMRSSLELEWRPMSFTIDAQAGLDWIEPLPGGDAAQELGYFVEAGVRWSF
jgi:hypothetical protein